MTLVPLRIAPKALTPLGVVDVIYTQELSLENFVENKYACVCMCVSVCLCMCLYRLV